VPDFPEHDPQIERARVKRFVIAGHFNLDAVKEMLAADPTLINGAIDWGNGDFETALGGASHMGRRDIAEFLLEHNARMDIFAATMLGKLEIVKAAVAAFPNIVRVLGPHKIPLIAHAEKGGSGAVAVLEFLRRSLFRPCGNSATPYGHAASVSLVRATAFCKARGKGGIKAKRVTFSR
jgi:hypothetical protein